MKLLVVCQYFYPEQFRVSDVCFKLAKMGHQVTVLTGLPNYPAGIIFPGYQWSNLKECSSSERENSGFFDKKLQAYTEEIGGIAILRCDLRPRLQGKKNLALNYFDFAFEGCKLAKKLAKAAVKDKKYDFDKILVFQYSPITMAMPAITFKKEIKRNLKKDIPLLLYSFDLWPESIVSAGLSNHGLIYNSVLRLSKYIYKKADLLLISSKMFESYFKEKLDIIHVTTKHLPIYAEELFAAKTLSKNDDSFNLLFAGNIGEMQSVDTILKAASKITKEKVHIHIVGDGSALEKNKSLAKELNLSNVTFHGSHPLEDMPKFYAMADAFLVTLKDDQFISYTLPGKVQSYMASARPIIAAINGETRDVVNESACGLCVPAEDFSALAAAIEKLSGESKETLETYGERARTYYENNFSEASFFGKLLEILN